MPGRSGRYGPVRAGAGLRSLLAHAPHDHESLLAVYLASARPARWTLADFPHLACALQRTAAVLGSAAARGEPGVNALLYGAPGTGKSECACAMARAAGLTPYLVRTEGDKKNVLDRADRLAAYAALQRLLRHVRDAVIVFDEVEDVFSSQGSLIALLSADGAAGENKGWINHTLEENPVPAIWITNDTRDMDPAFLRRFMLPIAFPTPPLEVRRHMAATHLAAGGVSEALREELARDERLQPAQYGMAARTLSLLRMDEPAAAEFDADDAVRASVAAACRLLHGRAAPAQRKTSATFEMQYLNVAGSIAPARIAAALARTGRGRLCFFGPPGTGKTEFAHVLAEALGRELVVKTAADLMSKYVGETEQRIQALFEQNDPERSLLLLDEVDSLLRSRAIARYSWEASQVNQLLQAMESWPGILVAATNLVTQLDPAALRRFDFKLEFRPLTAPQRRRLFAREAAGSAEQEGACPQPLMDRLSHMEGLTAGDFANVTRQRELLGEPMAPQDYLQRLTVELRLKSRAGDTVAA